MDLIAKGAEASIYKEQDTILKLRDKKSYRHPDLDKKIRRLRNKHEVKILETLEKNRFPAPRLISSNDTDFEMEFLDGPLMRDCLKINPKEFGLETGVLLAKLHDLGIAHADPTTSNMIVTDKINLIDFGLSFFSTKPEDQAVDIHLLDRAVQAAHPDEYIKFMQNVHKAYEKNKEDSKTVLNRLIAVEKRGRYKRKKLLK